jgi:hypothetical protein
VLVWSFAESGMLNAVDSPGRREYRLLLMAAAVNAVLFAAFLSCLTVGYESNDDVCMAGFASGLMTGKPSQDIIISSVLIGDVLKRLYQWTDRVNWYTLYLLAVHFATMTGLLYAFLRVRYSRTSFILFMLLFAEFEVALLLSLQFTSTAVTTAVVGVLLVIASSTPEAGKSRLAAVYGGLLIVLSGIIRSYSMYYAFVLLTPFLAYELALRRRWRTFGTVGAFLAVALAAIAYDAWHYRSDAGWRPYREYDALQGRLLDSPIVGYEASTKFFFDRIGWSRNDWDILQSCFGVDQELFSAAHLRAILDRFQGSTWGRTGAQQYLEERLSSVSVFRRLMYANILLAVLLCGGPRLRIMLLGACECLLVETLLLGFANYAKLVPRVVLPILFMPSFIVFFAVVQATSESRLLMRLRPGFRWTRGIAAVGAVVFCLWYAGFGYQLASRHVLASESNAGAQRGFRTFVRNIVSRYVDPDPKAVFFDWRGAFPWEFIPPFDNFRELRRIHTLMLAGWQTNNPHFADRVRRLGLGNLYRATYENPNVYLFARVHYLPWIKRFAQEHYQQKIFRARNDAFLVDTDSSAAAIGNFEFHVYQMAAGTSPRDVATARRSSFPPVGALRSPP